MFIFLPKHDIYGIEYETFRSDTYGIAFQYLTNWEVEENSLFDDDERDIIDIYGPNDERIHFRDDLQGDKYNNLQTFTKEYLDLVTSNTEEYEYEIIKEPTPTRIGDLQMGTFLFKRAGDGEEVGIQFWTIILDKQQYAGLIAGHQYAISFIAPMDVLNSPENTEFRNNFIKSVKFRPG